MLRINPDTGAGVPGNPMYSSSAPSSNASRILAYGFRNPFRFTMRPNSSEIWVADVGWGIYEEVNRITTTTPTKAPNFGWPCLEGQTHLSGYRDLDMCKALYSDDASPPSDPYFAYEHGLAVNGNDTCGTGANGTAISGASFYTGTSYPSSYSNAFFFADQPRNCIYVMTAGSNGLPDPSTTRTFVDDSDNPYPVDLKADPISKDIFYVNIGLGTVNRISYASSNRAPTAVASASPTSGAAPLAVTLNGTGSTDPDGDALSYSWDTDGNGTFGDATGPTPTVTYSNGGTYQARLLVTDPGGLSSTSSQVTITVTSASGPVNTSPPSISGTPQVGATLTSTTGAWTGTAPISYARQWQRCTTGSGTSYATAVTADAPLAYWRLGESSGTTAADASGNGRTGTYVGGVGLAKPGALSGDANTSVQLDGADDNVIRNPITGIGTTAISTDLWLKTSDTTKEAGIVSYAASTSADEFQLRDYRSLRVYVKGTHCRHRGLVERRCLASPRRDVELRRWCGARVQGRRAGILQRRSGSGRRFAHGGRRARCWARTRTRSGEASIRPRRSSASSMKSRCTRWSSAPARVQAHRDAAAGTGNGTTCSDIASATSASYSPQVADQGATIRVRVTATNGGGTSSAVSAAVGPVTGGSNTPPVPVINTPVSTLTWKAGDNVSFSGGATDAQDGTEPASRLSWSVIIGHCTTSGCHTHPLATRTGVASGTFAAPDHESPSYMELTLTATDAAGATASVTRRIDPQTVNLTFQTNPAGLSLAVGASQSVPARSPNSGSSTRRSS